MYAVVCSQSTSKSWSTAVKRLQDKYERRWPGEVYTVLYEHKGGGESSVYSCLDRLRELRPAYCCFVAHHCECSRDYIHQIHELTSQIDPSNPYSDTVWAVLTGLEEDDLLFAIEQDPLVVRRVLTHCPVELSQFDSGDWYSEVDACVHYQKLSKDAKVEKLKCQQDTTHLVAEAIGEDRDVDSSKGVDMIITSGHATERNWSLGFSYRNGRFVCQEGSLLGVDTKGSQIPVRHNRRAKVLSAAGNCLMGHIDGTNCMALAWMHAAGVVQMTGYLVPTWYGYGGWGVHKYFINLPGVFSFAEAFFANQQSLLAQLHHNHPTLAGSSDNSFF